MIRKAGLSVLLIEGSLQLSPTLRFLRKGPAIFDCIFLYMLQSCLKLNYISEAELLIASLNRFKTENRSSQYITET